MRSASTRRSWSTTATPRRTIRSSTSSSGSGRIKLKLGERTKAVNMFEKALEIQPGHRATLQALIDLYTDAGDFEAVIKQKRSLITSRDAGRREVHAVPRDRGDLQGEAQQPAEGDRRPAGGAQPQAGRSRAAARPAGAVQRDEAVEEGDGDPDEAGRAGQRRGQGALPDRGGQHRELRAALHRRSGGPVQPGPRRGPRRPEGLRADRQDHDREEGLEEPGAQLPQDDQAARDQDPTPDKKQTVVALWHALGEIYRSRLKDYKSAIAAFEVCLQMDPDATARHQILAELYQLSGPETYEQAIKAYRQLIKTTHRLRPDGGAPQDAAPAADGAAPVRQGVVRGGRGVVPAQGRRRGAAVLRAVQAQGVHARPRAADRGPVEARLPRRTRTATSRRCSRRSAIRSPRRAPRSTRTGASSARTSATSRTTSCCSARCSTTSIRCWASRRPSCICGRSRRARWIWPTRARRRTWCRRSSCSRACCRAVPRRSWRTSSPSG